MKKHLISVIIPVYNVELYLEACVNSVLFQTYKNLEIILVDDGSTDNCGLICDGYEKKYSNIKVVHKKNEGLGMARNSGLDLATGDYVYFIDSDDYIAEDEIEKIYNALIEHNVDVVITGYTSVNDNGDILSIRKHEVEVFEGDKARTEMLPRMIGSAPNKKDSLEMAAAGSMYSLKVIQKNKIRFVSERQMKNEDMVFNADFLQYANGGCVIDSIGQYYRNNPNSLSHKYQRNRFERDKVFYIEMKKKLLQLNYDYTVIERLQRHFFIHILIAIKQINDPRASLNLYEKLREIYNVCNDDLVRSILSEYPYKKLGIKQKVFIFMIKYKVSIFLVFVK